MKNYKIEHELIGMASAMRCAGYGFKSAGNEPLSEMCMDAANVIDSQSAELKAKDERIAELEAYHTTRMREKDEYRTELESRLSSCQEALRLAIRQNECDMVLTGDELRRCEAALAVEGQSS